MHRHPQNSELQNIESATLFIPSLEENLIQVKSGNMAPPQKALTAVTSAHAPLYPGGQETGRCYFALEAVSVFRWKLTSKCIGLFITEALHPFEGF